MDELSCHTELSPSMKKALSPIVSVSFDHSIACDDDNHHTVQCTYCNEIVVEYCLSYLDRVFALCETLAQLYAQPFISVICCFVNVRLTDGITICRSIPLIVRSVFDISNVCISNEKKNEDDRNEDRPLLVSRIMSCGKYTLSICRVSNFPIILPSCQSVDVLSKPE